jgi:hypothetical protein
MSASKFTYFRHSVTVRTNKKMVMLKDILGKRKREAYHFWFSLIELCASESDEGQTEFFFHQKTLRDLWEVSEPGVVEVCTAITLSELGELTSVGQSIKCRIVNLPEYLGSYSTKEIKKRKKENILLEKSPLSILFSESDKIQEWLLTGTEASQKELLDKHSHHVLAEEVKKAYLWQLEKSPRKAGTFLVTWMSNKKTAAFNPKRAQKSNSRITPGNPTGNPFLDENGNLKSEGA